MHQWTARVHWDLNNITPPLVWAGYPCGGPPELSSAPVLQCCPLPLRAVCAADVLKGNGKTVAAKDKPKLENVVRAQQESMQSPQRSTAVLAIEDGMVTGGSSVIDAALLILTIASAVGEGGIERARAEHCAVQSCPRGPQAEWGGV